MSLENIGKDYYDPLALARLVSLDHLYYKYLEYVNKARRNFIAYKRPTFGEYCEGFKKQGYRII